MKENKHGKLLESMFRMNALMVALVLLLACFMLPVTGGETVDCPAGSFCPASYEAPVPCPASSYCPASYAALVDTYCPEVASRLDRQSLVITTPDASKVIPAVEV